jgi:hypothetical protein
MMMENELLFKVYKSYIVKVAEKEGRAFRLPKDMSTLEKRTDLSFFIVLTDKLKEKKIYAMPTIQRFLDVAMSELRDFHVSDIVENFDNLHEVYKNVKEDNLSDIKKR